MLPSQPNQSLIDGLACLQALATSGKPVGVRDLARRLSLEPTRANRLLKTLAHLGIARQTDKRRYVPGPGMHVLAAQSIFASGLIRKSLPHLEGLSGLGMVVAFGVLWKDQVSYFYHCQPGASVEGSLGKVGLYPATRSSIGMVLLAERSDSEIGKICGGGEIPGHPGGMKGLLAKIREIRGKGYAVVASEKSNTSIAVTVGTPPHSAIAISGKMRNSQIEKYVDILRKTAGKIE